MAGGGGGGGALSYFHTYVGSGHFLVFKIFNVNIYGGFQKNEYFWGVVYEDFVDIFRGHHKIGLYLVSFLCILGPFLQVNGTVWGYFLGSLRFQIFFGVLAIPDIFFG